MVKISFGGYDDGEGSSNPTQKRRRVEEEEDEDDQQPQQGFEMEDPPIGSQEQEHNNNNSGNEETAESNGNPGQRHNRARPVSVVFTDPDVLDCFICYEPLTVPVFQVSFPSCMFLFLCLLFHCFVYEFCIFFCSVL